MNLVDDASLIEIVLHCRFRNIRCLYDPDRPADRFQFIGIQFSIIQHQFTVDKDLFDTEGFFLIRPSNTVRSDPS